MTAPPLAEPWRTDLVKDCVRLFTDGHKRAEVEAWLRDSPSAQLPLYRIRSLVAEAERIADTQARDSEGPKEPEKLKRPSQATQLVSLAEDVELFHDADHVAYAVVPVNDHRETHRLRSGTFRRYLARRFYYEMGKAAGGQAVQDALQVLEGKAIFEGPEYKVHVRLGGDDDAIFLDLGDASWRVVRITAAGWEVVHTSPVRFVRPAGMLALPEPAQGGSLGDLRVLLNVGSEEDWALVLGWLLGAFRASGPYPLLVITGPQGSSKSTLAAALVALLDPRTSDLRAKPRDERDLLIAAKNAWVLSFDNLGGLDEWLSDALCRISTGGSLSTRELYSDSDEIHFRAERPVIVNGIEEVLSRADALDRAIIVQLPAIRPEQRRTKHAWTSAFDAVRPTVLGALLSALSTALSRVKSVTPPATLPRMADFALWVHAAEPALGLDGITFEAAYAANRANVGSLALEADVVATKVKELAEEWAKVENPKGRVWRGTAAALLSELDSRAGDRLVRSKAWPSTPRALSGRLRRAQAALAAASVDVTFSRGKAREITIGKQAAPSVGTDGTDAQHEERTPSVGPTVQHAPTATDAVAPAVGTGGADANDGADGATPPSSRQGQANHAVGADGPPPGLSDAEVAVLGAIQRLAPGGEGILGPSWEDVLGSASLDRARGEEAINNLLDQGLISEPILGRLRPAALVSELRGVP